METQHDDADTPSPIAQAVLGETQGEHRLCTRADHRRAALSLVTQARHQVLIMGRELDPEVYGNETFVAAISALARRSPHSTIQVLVRDTEPLARHGHGLVALAQRLSSSMAIHRLNPDYHTTGESFLVVDGYGVLYRPQSDHYEGTVDLKAPSRARALMQGFEAAWTHSRPDPGLRRLQL
jgi:hypothetical protein